MNSARVCWIIKMTVFNVYVTPVGNINTTNLKGVMKNQGTNVNRALLVAFIKYTLLYTKL